MTKAGIGWRRVVTGALLAAAAPALADVKAGVDAWTRGDYARAVAEWRGPALAGDPDAQFNLGQAYKLGRGVPADLAQAEIWYQKAAARGHARAQDNYGLALFQDGRKADALPWLEKSAARDEKRAELVLGTMLFNGDAVTKDWVRAYALVSRSSQQGVPQASQTLAQLDGYLSPEQREQGVALATRMADQARTQQLAAMAGPPASRGGGTVAEQGSGPNTTIASADVPASTAPARHPKQDRPDVARPSHPEPAPSPRPSPQAVPPHEKIKPAVAPPPRAQAAVAAGGHWKVQLGAFRDEANAHSLWASVGGRVGGRPSFVKTGGVTRLQAGPFATKADAERACHAAGSSCVVLP